MAINVYMMMASMVVIGAVMGWYAHEYGPHVVDQLCGCPEVKHAIEWDNPFGTWEEIGEAGYFQRLVWAYKGGFLKLFLFGPL